MEPRKNGSCTVDLPLPSAAGMERRSRKACAGPSEAVADELGLQVSPHLAEHGRQNGSQALGRGRQMAAGRSGVLQSAAAFSSSLLGSVPVA